MVKPPSGKARGRPKKSDQASCDGDRLDAGDSDSPLLSAGGGNVVNGDTDSMGDKSDSNHGTDTTGDESDKKYGTDTTGDESDLNHGTDTTGDESDKKHGTDTTGDESDSEVEQRDLKPGTNRKVVHRRLCDREVRWQSPHSDYVTRCYFNLCLQQGSRDDRVSRDVFSFLYV